MDPITRRNMWRDRIERCLSSGMTNSEWCRLNKVVPSTLYSWIAKFRKEEADLFPKRNTSEWIEVTKQGLAASVAMVPATSEVKSSSASTKSKGKKAAPRDTPNSSSPAIHARINGVEMSIAPGCRQSDIEAVFKAAASL